MEVFNKILLGIIISIVLSCLTKIAFEGQVSLLETTALSLISFGYVLTFTKKKEK